MSGNQCPNCHASIGSWTKAQPERKGERPVSPVRRVPYVIGNLLVLPGYLIASFGALVTVILLFVGGNGGIFSGVFFGVAVWLFIAPGLAMAAIGHLLLKWAHMRPNNTVETDARNNGARGSP
jgi:hypothetical protein